MQILLSTILALLAAAGITTAGDCHYSAAIRDGVTSHWHGCGCYDGWCWAFLKPNSQEGARWCYTQILGFVHGQLNFARCSRDSDCDWGMTCGSDRIHTGNDKILKRVIEKKAASPEQ